ncbi:MAG TPA: hypothetical protein VIJ20_01910, partial [Solirubrobacteraceae bacterium]
MQRPSKDRHLFSLVGAFALVAVVFLVAAVVAQRAAVQIDSEVADLRSNSLPSVTHLARARTEMGHLLPEIEALADVPPGGRPEALARIAKLRGALDADLDSYVQTPWYAG